MKMIKIYTGNIVDYKEVDVIVNAANSTLLGGSGVDGAIHKAAGNGLFKECVTLLKCDTGEAKVTGAYNLAPVKHIIHTVAPIYDDYEKSDRERLLHSCYYNLFRSFYGLYKTDNTIKRIVIPSLGTGAYGWPIEEAAPIAISVTQMFNLCQYKHKQFEITFCLFSSHDTEVYERELAKLLCRGSPQYQKLLKAWMGAHYYILQEVLKDYKIK